MSIVETFKVTLDFNVIVDENTGEIKTECVKKSIDKAAFKSTEVKTRKKSNKKVETTIPTLTLEENKYCLNQAAVDLMEVNPNDKLDIKYEKQGKTIIPVITIDDRTGNKLTKSFTVACRGTKNEELSKFGQEFKVIPHNQKPNAFILENTSAKAEELETLEEIEETTDIDIDIQSLIDDDVTEIPSSLFQL